LREKKEEAQAKERDEKGSSKKGKSPGGKSCCCAKRIEKRVHEELLYLPEMG